MVKIGDSVKVVSGKEAGLSGVVMSVSEDGKTLVVRRVPSRFGERFSVRIADVTVITHKED